VEIVVGVNDHIDSIQEIRERYRREVGYVDRQIGGILDALREKGLYDSSWIVFASDHGEGLGCHEHLGHVQNLYECLMRVPLIVKPPVGSKIRAETRRNDAVSLADIGPTLLRALETTPVPHLSGVDLFSKEYAPRPVFLETHTPQARQTKYGLCDGEWKVIWTPESDLWELYDLVADTGENQNVIASHPSASKWKARLENAVKVFGRRWTYGENAATPSEQDLEMLRSLGYVE
jgi:arylsulfatase A-like enzyme